MGVARLEPEWVYEEDKQYPSNNFGCEQSPRNLDRSPDQPGRGLLLPGVEPTRNRMRLFGVGPKNEGTA